MIAQFTSKYYENRFLDSYDNKINNLEKIYKEIVKKEKIVYQILVIYVLI